VEARAAAGASTCRTRPAHNSTYGRPAQGVVSSMGLLIDLPDAVAVVV
jgi:hypothetical protein